MRQGQILHVLTTPTQELTSLWMNVRGDIVQRAWRSAVRSVEGTPTSLHCRLSHHQTQGWLSGVNGFYQGEPADRLRLTVRLSELSPPRSQTTAQLVDLSQPAGQRRWEDTGTIHAQADEPTGY
jgi:hypothetical protein